MNQFPVPANFPFANLARAQPWSYFRLPVSIEALLETHRKNTVALTNASQAALEGFTTVVQCQGSLWETMLDEYKKVASDVLATASCEEKARNEAGAGRHIYGSTFVRYRELYHIATNANVAAVDILTARIVESFEELKTLFAVPGALAASASADPPPLIAQPVAAGGKEADAPIEVSPPVQPATRTSAEPPPVVAEPVAKTQDIASDADAPVDSKPPKKPTAQLSKPPPKATRRPRSRR